MTIDFADTTGDQLRHAAHTYHLELGWTTTVDGNQLALELDDDLWGLRMPTALAVELVAALRAMDFSCPVVDLAEPSVVLLEPVEVPVSTPRLPAAVGRLPSGCRVPLPPSVTGRGPVRWLTHEPDGGRRPSVRVVTDTLARLIP
ncbi:hypothetical protein [Actinophytocola oryzae]|nr:hypothetical protein [Actinophytocola oryzae]